MPKTKTNIHIYNYICLYFSKRKKVTNNKIINESNICKVNFQKSIIYYQVVFKEFITRYFKILERTHV